MYFSLCQVLQRQDFFHFCLQVVSQMEFLECQLHFCQHFFHWLYFYLRLAQFSLDFLVGYWISTEGKVKNDCFRLNLWKLDFYFLTEHFDFKKSMEVFYFHTLVELFEARKFVMGQVSKAPV